MAVLPASYYKLCVVTSNELRFSDTEWLVTILCIYPMLAVPSPPKGETEARECLRKLDTNRVP